MPATVATAKAPVARMVAFFLLSYALTWFGHLFNYLLPSVLWPRPMFPLGPFIAAIAVIGVTEGRTGLAAWFRRIGNLKAPLRTYAAAVLIPVAIIATSVVLAVAAGAQTPSGDSLSRWWVVFALIPIGIFFGPIFEEPSFRGYGQHDLQRTWSPLASSLAIGIGVLVWHAPVLIDGSIPWTIALLLPVVSVIYAWLYQNGGSVWPLVALHTVQNLVGGEYVREMFGDHGNLLWTGFETAFFVGWAAIIIWRYGPSLTGEDRSRSGATKARRGSPAWL